MPREQALPTRPLAVVTGAGSGIGRALAVEADRRGYRLLLCGRRLEALQATRALLTSGDGLVVPADVTDPSGRLVIHRAVDGIGGSLDLLVHCAGLVQPALLSETADHDLERMLQTNLAAPLLLTRDLRDPLAAAAGRIVFVGSTLGIIGHPYFSAYCATKHGLYGLADSLRRELAEEGIGVTYAAPRAVRTAASEGYSAIARALNMRMDAPEDVAADIMNGVEKGVPTIYPRGMERIYIGIQRLFPGLIDQSLMQAGRKVRTAAATKVTALESAPG